MNVNIKKPYQTDDVSISQALEYKKCMEDPKYFIENYVYITTDEGAIKFPLREYQRKIINSFLENTFNIILQPRQSGKSTTIVALFLWLTVFYPEKVVGFAAHKGTNAKDLIKRFKFAYEMLPNWLKPGVLEYNVHNVMFDNQSGVISTTTTEDSFRGITLTGGIYLDEFSFVTPLIANEFYSSILPTLTGGNIENKKIIITSTPRNSDDLFADIWFGAINGMNGFNAIEVKYDEIPGRDDNFRESMLKKMSPSKFAQEFENCFISDTPTLIRSMFLESLVYKSPIYKIDEIDFYGEVKTKEIFIGIDVAEGIGDRGDYSVMQIFDKNTFEQIGEYRNNTLSISDFAKKIIKTFEMLKSMGAVGIFYTIESNPIGMGVIHLLLNSPHHILDEVEFVSQKKKKGVLMTQQSKLRGCSRFKDLVESKRMILHSRSLISELKFFTKKAGSFAAEKGKHDDLVMGCVITVLGLIELSRFDDGIDEKMNDLVYLQFEDEERGEGDGFLPVLF